WFTRSASDSTVPRGSYMPSRPSRSPSASRDLGERYAIGRVPVHAARRSCSLPSSSEKRSNALSSSVGRAPVATGRIVSVMGASLAERCHAAALGWVSRVPHGPVVSNDNRNGSVNLPRAATLVFCDEVTHSGPFGNSVSHMSRCQLVPVVGEPLLGDRRVRPIGCGCHSSGVRRVPFHDHAPVPFAPFL